MRRPLRRFANANFNGFRKGTKIFFLEKPFWLVVVALCATSSIITVLQTDTGEHVNLTKAFERTVVKELGKFLPYLRKKGDPKINFWGQENRGGDCLLKTHDSAK